MHESAEREHEDKIDEYGRHNHYSDLRTTLHLHQTVAVGANDRIAGCLIPYGRYYYIGTYSHTGTRAKDPLIATIDGWVR